jgi:nucleoid-associated protein EbfC
MMTGLSRVTINLWLIAIALLALPQNYFAFQTEVQHVQRPRPHQQNHEYHQKSKEREPLPLHIWGFGSDNKAGSSSKANKNPDATLGDAPDSTTTSKGGTLGGVAGIMDSMDGFKNSQRIGKRTGALVQELMMLNVEGMAEGGKVKVTMDGQQRPVSTFIDETYLESAEASDVAQAITLAMKDAHTKSTEKMDEKMKNFFHELGLPG